MSDSQHPVTGRPLILTGPAEAAAYVLQARGTGPQALAPTRELTGAPAIEAGCGCAPAAPVGTPNADVLQARAIHRHLAEWLTADRRAYGWNADAAAASVRVASAHGLYELFVPPIAKPFPIYFHGRRDGALDARRVPATTDSLVATLYAAYLRDRGEI
ncbi:hypothetical protein QMK19_29075 [Streptomyces sp. H10-C2]|uniref:hypothetical protein n=1 Tax=unclassified Streptomyces TaxID=2593676 RepID=UPI0024B8F1EC|nr:MULTISPECIES: hypothetical protein [unclassified Streptomyces]MDJ0344264.1 hypothetical protein [Streptomyces sp. PH10-H1]MDJ0373602.1 hypothetical protein [Streptomyces sp. H10-C2]